MKRALAIVLLLSAVTAVGAPWVLGTLAERIYMDNLAGLSLRGLRLVDSRFERGWFASRARAELAVASGAPGLESLEELPVRISSRIAHGPWSLQALRWPPAAAVVESEVEIPIRKINPPPLLLSTILELDGSGVTRLRLPAVEPSSGVEGAVFETEEGRGEVRFDPGFTSTDGWFELPALRLDSKGGVQVSLRDLRTESRGARWIGGLFAGTGTLTLAEMKVSSPEGTMDARGVSVSVEGLPDGELWNLRAEYRVGGLLVNGGQYAPSKVAVSFSRIPGEEIASLQRALGELSAEPMDGPVAGLAMASILAGHLPRLLAPEPAVRLDALDISTPQGKVEGGLSLAIRGLTAEDLDRPGAWLEHLVGDGELSLPEPLLLALLEGWRRQQVLKGLRARDDDIDAVPAGLEPEISAAARDQLSDLLRDGWLTERQGRLTTTVKLADALLTVNGKTIPLAVAGRPLPIGPSPPDRQRAGG